MKETQGKVSAEIDKGSWAWAHGNPTPNLINNYQSFNKARVAANVMNQQSKVFVGGISITSLIPQSHSHIPLHLLSVYVL